jgi:hypothetical protein
MIGDTLTLENLLAIQQAMQKIKPIDRSECFNNYYDEIVQRIAYKEIDRQIIESRLKRTVQEQSGNSQGLPG